MAKLRKGNLVKCKMTGHIGIYLGKALGNLPDAHILVLWNGQTAYTHINTWHEEF